MKHDRSHITVSARHRAGARGAAMLEGVIVISMMLIFLGLIVWTRQAYGMKLDLQQRTRSETLFFASHACEDAGGGVGQIGGGGTVPGDAGPAANTATKSGLADVTNMSRKWNTATGSLNGKANGQAVWDQNAHDGRPGIRYGTLPLVSNVTASSTFTCNEKKSSNKSQLIAWFQYGIDFLKSGGGVMGLFQ